MRSLPTFQNASDEADAADRASWRWQARNAATDLATLERVLRLTDREREGIRRAAEGGFPISITPYYLSLVDPEDPDCPIRRQCVPRAEEGLTVEGDLRDPLGEEAHEVAPHLVRRYPDRALLIATSRCSVYCRFCTRSRMVGQDGGARSLAGLEPAFRYLEEHPEVAEVIVSGGDPLVMSTSRLAALLERLSGIESLLHMRLATRAPVTLPQRIDEELCRALRASGRSLWLMTHFNHPKELSEESLAACERLVDHGIPVMNQTVLLRGVNDRVEVLTELFRGLVRARVRPYYLLQADPVRGTGHLRTPLGAGVALMEALQGRLSGIALPKLIVDTPRRQGEGPPRPGLRARAAAGADPPPHLPRGRGGVRGSARAGARREAVGGAAISGGCRRGPAGWPAPGRSPASCARGAGSRGRPGRSSPRRRSRSRSRRRRRSSGAARWGSGPGRC